jgi:hypothetical protein
MPSPRFIRQTEVMASQASQLPQLLFGVLDILLLLNPQAL